MSESKARTSYQDDKKRKTNILSNEDRKKKVFEPKEATEVIRVIRDDVAYFHQMKVGDYNQKIYCPKHNDGKECPICAKEAAIKATQTKTNYKDQTPKERAKNKDIFNESRKYQAAKFYIMEVIDNGSPKDGKKFWRFKHAFTQQGAMDFLVPQMDDYKAKHGVEYTDVEKGANVKLTVVDAVYIKSKYKKVISAIIDSTPTPLSTDPTKVNEWTTDPTTWRQVFPPNTLPGFNAQQYLQGVIDGNLPHWDADKKKFINPDGTEAKVNKSEFTQQEEKLENSKDNVSDMSAEMEAVIDDAPEDDLPF